MIRFLDKSGQPHSSELGCHFLPIVAAGNDNRNFLADAPNLGKSFMTIHVRHGQIQNHTDNLLRLAAEDIQSLQTVGGYKYVKPEMLQHVACYVANGLFVVHNKYCSAPLPGIIKAKKRKLPAWSVSDLETDTSSVGAAGAKTTLEKLALPDFEGACEFIQGENLAEAAANLVDRLKTEKIL